MIEKNFDIPFISDLALHEKQIQQNYRPIIAVHKWFARRPGTLFRGLLLSEFAGGSLRDNFYKAHNFKGIKVADPFMGGGTPLIEANRLGCDIVGYDINPMAYWIVRQEIENIDLKAYREAAAALQSWLEKKVGSFYRTLCMKCGSPNAHVKYFIWVKTLRCGGCGETFDLFPGYLLAANRRHPKNVVICSACGQLNEVEDRKYPGICHDCGEELKINGPANRNRCQCPYCGKINSYPDALNGIPRHRMVAIEYHCPVCKPSHQGRFFKKPDEDDMRKYEEASRELAKLKPIYISDDEIPPPPCSLDAVLTDPPYYANVQYAELMDFCYVWLRRLAKDDYGVFNKSSTRDENELTGNITMERGLSHFTEGLAAVFIKIAFALKRGAPLVFTYHHNTIEAYFPVAVAVLDAGLTCSASIPCPAEMGASIHINGTGSSVIDTVFVCRSTGSVPRRAIVFTPEEIAGLVYEDLKLLQTGNVKLTRGDIRCVAYGHLVRLAIWNLRKNWSVEMSVTEKMKTVALAIEQLGGWAGVERHLAGDMTDIPFYRTSLAREEQGYYGGEEDEISF